MQVTFLSWNLAMLNRSDQAPVDWTDEHTQAEVRRLVLDLSPDVVAFQELPGVVPYVETHEMMRSNPMSHSGNLATLVGHHLIDDAVDRGPTVTAVRSTAVLTTLPEAGFTVANVHLVPGPGAMSAKDRADQLARVVEACPTEQLLVIGDTNTRVEEMATVAELGLTGARPPSPTWDSVRNRFRADGAEFRAYFTRYLHTGGLVVDDVEVHRWPITGTGGPPFHLSDHFALSGRCGPA